MLNLFPIALLRNSCNIFIYYNCVFYIFEYVLFVLILFDISTFQFYSSKYIDARLLPCIRPNWMRFRIYSFYIAVKLETLVARLKHCKTIFGPERTNISLNIRNYQETDDFWIKWKCKATRWNPRLRSHILRKNTFGQVRTNVSQIRISQETDELLAKCKNWS